MGLMELELARAEHRLREAETERRNGVLRALSERKRNPRRQQESGPDGPEIDWPLLTLRFGPFQLALFRTVRLPASDSHGTSRLLLG